MIILIHSSKTMRPPAVDTLSAALQQPQLLGQASQLAARLQQLTVAEVAAMMQVSPKLAVSVHDMAANWTANPGQQRPAIDSFLGDIYSGLQVRTWSAADRRYADQHLRILSGLYGILRPLDGIYPYRLELGYRLPTSAMSQLTGSLYDFWADSVATTLPQDAVVINLAAVEYSKLLTKYPAQRRIVTPRFLTVSPTTGLPTFVTVHTKIARGAYAAWLVTKRIANVDRLTTFCELGYQYSAVDSTPDQPVFICQTFGGLGLSVRLL